MTWTTPTNVSTGTASSSKFNTETVANLQHLYDLLHVWADYTPTLSGMTLGNGTMNARYKRAGDIVHAQVSILFGSTTSVSGSVGIGLPVSAAYAETADDHAAVGVVSLFDAIGRRYTGHAIVGSATSASIIHAETPTSGGGSVNATNPITWATSDRIHLSITYEAA